MEYRLNHGETCFGTSLANYFIHIWEENIARNICEKYRFSPLVKSNGGVSPALMTRITRDLTRDEYVSTLLINWDGNPIEDIRGLYREGFDTPDIERLFEIYREEIHLGNIITSAENMPVPSPSIVLFNTRFDYGHAAVYMGNERFIDNGFYVGRDDFTKNGMGYSPVGFLKIKKGQ